MVSKNFKHTVNILSSYINALYLLRKFKNRDDLRDWQEKKMRLFFNEVLSKSPFYKNYSYENFQEIPVISKADMMKDFSIINTVGVGKEEAMSTALQAEGTRFFDATVRGYTVGLSSGTSGSRGLFIVSPEEQEAWAGIMLAQTLGCSLLRKQRIALFLRSNSNLYEKIGESKHISFTYFDITQRISSHFEDLTELAPTALTAPASVLKYLAQAQKKREIDILPRHIFSCAEVLDLKDQLFIEQVFQVPVRQIYQCTEGLLGVSDKENSLRLNEEYVFIEKEYVDKERTRFVPIITDFTRKSQPIVRYRLDDILVEQKQENLIFTKISQIEGRCDDIFYFIAQPNQQKQTTAIYPDALRQAIISSGVGYEEYQLIQGGYDAITFKIHPALEPKDQKNIVDAIISLSERNNCLPPSVNFAPYDFKVGAQKLRRIIRQFEAEAVSAA